MIWPFARPCWSCEKLDIKQDAVSGSISKHTYFTNNSNRSPRTNRDLISLRIHTQVRLLLLSFTHNGGLSHIRYAFCCCVQVRLSSHSSMSKCHIIRARIERISNHARLKFLSAKRIFFLLPAYQTVHHPLPGNEFFWGGGDLTFSQDSSEGPWKRAGMRPCRRYGIFRARLGASARG